MKNFNTILRGAFILLVLACVVAAVASCSLGGHEHTLTKVDKVDATCTESGCEKYFVCTDCDKLFADFGATLELEAPKTIPAAGHKIVGILGKAPTCSDAGVADCYKCTECNTLFSDLKGENEIDAPIAIDPTSHDLVKTESKAATCTDAGNIEFFGCKTCKAIFSDEACTVKISAEETVVPALGHKLSATAPNPATCTADGNIAYWTCDGCKLVYANADATELAGDVVIPATGHSFSEILVINGGKTNYEPGAYFSTEGLSVEKACSCGHSEAVSDYTYDKTGPLTAEDTLVTFNYTEGDVNYYASLVINVIHVHTVGELVAAVAPTCVLDGTVAHYECTICHAKFADELASTPLDSIVDPAKGHSGVKTEAKPATCTAVGNIAYWTCRDCSLIFADEACTEQISAENTVVPTANHSTAVASDSEGHWSYCVNCDYKGEKESHTGFAYPGENATCNACGTSFGAESNWDGWVQFRPGISKVEGSLVSSATHVNINGVMASHYVFNAAGAGTESTIWTHEEKSTYHNGNYQVRIPTVGSKERYVYLYVSNDGDTAVSFRIYSENYGDKGGVDISLGAGESGYFKYSVHTGTTIGSNVNLKLLSDLASATEITVYGHWYLATEEIAGLQIKNMNSLKLSYEVGEVFDISNMVLTTYIIMNDKGELLSDGGEELFYIADNYTVTGLTNGQTLTEAGNYEVTISFGGKSLTLNVTVSSHEHNLVYVPYTAAGCDKNGNTAHYICNVDGCGQYFADAQGNSPISSESVVIAKGHMTAQLPGTAEYCTRCGTVVGDEVMSGEHWVLFRPEIDVGSGSFPGWKAEYTDVDGVYGSMFTFGADVNAGDRIRLTMWNEQGNFQTIIPNGLDAAVANRKVIMYYHNYGTEPITIKFQNDSNSSIYDEVTIPAGGVVVSSFDHPKSGGGSNWFYLQVQNDIQSDVTVGVYGYFYLENEFDSISILNKADKLTFVEGETFTAEGLMLKTSGGIKTTFIETGYTTNFDGKVFDKAGKYTVEVYFGGKTVTYEIEVTAHKHNLEQVAGKDAVKCVEDGYEAYYMCTVAGCGEKFADAEGNTKITSPKTIPCHTATATLPGQTVICADCGAGYAVYENDTLVHFTPGKPGNPGENPYYETISGTVDGTSTISKNYTTIDGNTAVDYLIKAGTPANSSITLWCDNGNKIPVRLQNGGTKVIMSVTNHGNENITISVGVADGGRDMGSGTALVPAGQTVAIAFVVTGGADYGNNIWFAVRNDVSEDTHVSVHGYFDIESDAEVGIKIANQANKTSFTAGETFTAEGLTLRLKNDKPVDGGAYYGFMYIHNFTTNLDGQVLTAGEHEVIVYFGGHTATYTITVTE